MESNCANQHIQCIEQIFDNIFSYDIKEKISINKIYPRPDEDCNCKNCVIQILNLFNVFGVIDLNNINNDCTVNVKSVSSKYFIKSLLEYIKSGKQLLTSWEDSKGAFPVLNENNLFIGPNILYYMEKNRIDICDDAKTIGKLVSARAIIKDEKDGIAKYLFQYDQKTHQFKVIGGEIEPYDKSEKDALKREIKEELHLSSLKYSENYTIGSEHKVNRNYFSKKYGAYLNIDLFYYQIFISDENALVLDVDDCWLTMSELRKGKAADGRDIFKMEPETLDFMEALPISFHHLSKTGVEEKQKVSISSIFKSSVTKIIGGLLTAIATLLTIIGFFIN